MDGQDWLSIMANCDTIVGKKYVIKRTQLSTRKGQYFNFHLLITPKSKQ